MDQSTLVDSGTALVKALDKSGLVPRAALWVHASDNDTWKLWLVPPKGIDDKLDFYRRVSVVVNEHPEELNGIDASDTHMVLDSHPAVKGLKHFMRAPGLNNIRFSGNMYDGFYLPDGIILRIDL
jgi:hypothetical protein